MKMFNFVRRIYIYSRSQKKKLSYCGEKVSLPHDIIIAGYENISL